MHQADLASLRGYRDNRLKPMASVIARSKQCVENASTCSLAQYIVKCSACPNVCIIRRRMLHQAAYPSPRRKLSAEACKS